MASETGAAASSSVAAAGTEAADSWMASPMEETCHRRLVLLSLTTTLSIGLMRVYTKLVPKLPQLYAVLLRAAMWDCVIVGVFIAQLVDLSTVPFLSGTDGGHFLPTAVILYHGLTMLVCSLYDMCTGSKAAQSSRNLHRALMSRRVLFELAGGMTGDQLLLGRLCFVASATALWMVLQMLLWSDDESYVLSGFVMSLNACYCAAGFAALESKRTFNGRMVQWLCTGWEGKAVFLQGPLKIVGAVFLLPVGISVLVAQICLRTVAFLVWLTLAWPCCRLRSNDNVYDTFEREMALPLLQSSFLAFGCTTAAYILGFNDLTARERTAVGIVTLYYLVMLVAWAAPTVLQARTTAEEVLNADTLLTEDEEDRTSRLRQRLFAGGESVAAEGGDIELEDVRATCEELRALLFRERHDSSVQIAQLQAKLKDQEAQLKRLATTSHVELPRVGPTAPAVSAGSASGPAAVIHSKPLHPKPQAASGERGNETTASQSPSHQLVPAAEAEIPSSGAETTRSLGKGATCTQQLPNSTAGSAAARQADADERPVEANTASERPAEAACEAEAGGAESEEDTDSADGEEDGGRLLLQGWTCPEE
eukprot:TRINITY_DN111693_c0_g1_i1.p1 TRINITY_DN111693_c0_g1~~TRINITY_DN111693_c0_g1_i1.p1  ORF type:complete len:594 (-),score=112.15 TRINITY_DN111693_c0_g1_i1:76-1857(-)